MSARTQVLFGSRMRSGSTIVDEDEPPTSLPSPPPDEEPPDFPPVYKADSLPRTFSKPVGSKVSQMREKFQSANGTSEEPPFKFQPIKSYHHQVARSPPSALSPRSQTPVNQSGRSQSASTSALHKAKEPPTSPTSSNVVLFPPSSHVQRFNYTRALFARMEEETKQEHEREKSAMLRRPSPTPGRSPVVSPTWGFCSPIGHTGSLSLDETDARKKMRLSADSDEAEMVVPTNRRSRADHRPPPVPSRKPDRQNVPRPAYSEPSITKAVSSAVSNTPGGLLWKRRQNDGNSLTNICNSDKFHDSKNRTSLSSSSSHIEVKSDSMDTLDNSVFSNSNGSLSEDLSITSAYNSRKPPYFPSDNSKFIQGRSASTEVLNSRSSNDPVRSRSHDVHSEVSEDDGNVDKGGVVSRRTRAENIASHPSKRLSKEEIQAAIDRADTYLRSTSTSSEEGDLREKRHSSDDQMIISDITSNSSGVKEVVPSKNMSQSDSSVRTDEKPDSELKSWALYRKQRYSRSSDYMDDKVGDVTKLGSISDISVSGFRKASMENVSKTPDLIKCSDPFAAISQSSVLMNRRSVPSVQQKPTSLVPNYTAKNSETTVSDVSEENSVSQSFKRDSGCTDVEKSADNSKPTMNSSEHSIPTSSGVISNSRPIPVPRRTAPTPPSGPPPPPPAVHYSHSPTASIAPPSEQPPTAPEPEFVEEILEEDVTKISQSEALSSIPPVPGLEIQMRDKARFLSLDEPMETSDSEDPLPVLERAGSRKALIIENVTELPQREDGDGTEHPEIQQEPSISSDHTSLLLHDSLPPPPAYPGHSKLPQYNIEEELSDVDEEPDDNSYHDIDGLSATSSESEEEYIDYGAKKDRKIRFSRAAIRVFMTYSTDDYDRRNEEIDPVAASAEYELEKRVERMDVFPVDLIKGPEGLGLSIIGMGVGADAGLEKLGIFIKTLTDGGAAQRSAKMQVNDQIIEVDGKSLVGVTQAYAASVLRNTSGEVK